MHSERSGGFHILVLVYSILVQCLLSGQVTRVFYKNNFSSGRKFGKSCFSSALIVKKSTSQTFKFLLYQVTGKLERHHLFKSFQELRKIKL